jgi:hypothetical protein
MRIRSVLLVALAALAVGSALTSCSQAGAPGGGRSVVQSATPAPAVPRVFKADFSLDSPERNWYKGTTVSATGAGTVEFTLSADRASVSSIVVTIPSRDIRFTFPPGSGPTFTDFTQKRPDVQHVAGPIPVTNGAFTVPLDAGGSLVGRVGAGGEVTGTILTVEDLTGAVRQGPTKYDFGGPKQWKAQSQP